MSGPIEQSQLTSTSYAILGMVGLLGECTTYELGKSMQGSFDYFWPRARSLIYAEVKRLADLGLLDSRREYVGKRPRTIYAITPLGREALAVWLSTPPKTFALEFEGLLRVYLAPFGRRDDLLRALETVAEQAETMLRVGSAFRRSYLDGTSPFMDQVHVIRLTQIIKNVNPSCTATHASLTSPGHSMASPKRWAK